MGQFWCVGGKVKMGTLNESLLNRKKSLDARRVRPSIINVRLVLENWILPDGIIDMTGSDETT